VVIREITSVKPLTPQQSRIAALKTQKDSISKQLKTERDRQKITKAQQQLAKVQSSIL
jgi:capsule polysaccharide export protein KpsE/RkpR